MKRDFDLEWLSSSQWSEKGSSSGGFDYQKDKWTARVYLKATEETFRFESRSHRKVATWLRNMQRKYDLR